MPIIFAVPAIQAAVDRLMATAIRLAERAVNDAMQQAAQALRNYMNGREPVLFQAVKVQEPETTWQPGQRRSYNNLQGARGAGHYEVRVVIIRHT